MEKLSRGSYILLCERLSGEADGIFSALSTEDGKISLIAKGICKGSSRRRTVLQVGHWVELELMRGRGLPIATSAVLRERFIPEGANYPTLSVMMYLLELIDRLLLEGEEAREYAPLVLALLRLGTTLRPLTWLLFSEETLLDRLGYGQSLAFEDSPLTQRGLYFHGEEGFSVQGPGLYLDAGCLSYLRALVILPPERLAALHCDRVRAKTLALYFQQRLIAVLGYPLRSRSLALKAIDPSFS